ncbi:MAG: hypothetical protein V4501_13020, partial [Pseudomonadota bacterium]
MAAAREALFGLSHGLRAFQDGMTQLGQASVRFGVACKSVAILSKKFATDTTRAYYNVAGQHTFPIEQELVGSQPPQPENLNLVGRICISLPVILPTVLLSVTAIPFFGNSIQSFPRGAVDVINLSLADLPDEEQISILPDQRNTLRKIYGGAGYLSGGLTLGMPIALTVGAGRIIANTCLSIPITFVPLVNLALADENALVAEVEPRTNTAYALGIPGLGLGAMLGVLGMIGMVVSRIVINSCISLGYNFIKCLNIALPQNANNQIVLGPDERRMPSYLFGIPGILLGAIFGGISALFVTGAISTHRVFLGSLNSALAYNDQINIAPDNRSALSKALGLIPGVIIGGVFGELSGLVILLGRFVINTCKSFSYFFQHGLSLGLPAPLTIADEQRESGSLWLGALGAITGAISGFVTGCIASTAISIAGCFLTVTNIALHQEDQIKLGPDKRTLLGKIMGVVGLLIGLCAGVVSALTVFLSRIMINSAKSWLYGFKYTLNMGLPEAARLSNEETREASLQQLGYPGLVIGGCLGMVTAFFASTAITTAGVWMIVTNLSLEEKFVLGNDTRSTFGKILGGLGLVIGGIAGLISAFIVTCGQMLGNGRFSFILYFKKAINLSLPQEYQLALAPDHRTTLKKLFALPNSCIGALLGGVVAFFISTALTTAGAFKTITNFALENELDVTDTRSTPGKILGGFGWILGSITGLLGAIGVACARLFSNSGISFLHFFKLGLNVGLPSDYYLTTEDNRRLTNKVFGVPGLSLGAIFGGITAFFASTGITTARSFVYITNLVLDPNDEISIVRDKRSNLGIAISVFGLIPGTIAGLISAFFVGFTRIVFNTGVTALYYMKKVSNLGLPGNERFADEIDARTTVGKVLGCLGIPIGCVIGGIGAVFISSLQTFGRTFALLFNLPWQGIQISFSPDLRSGLGIIIGILAIPFGLTIGLVGALIPVGARMIYEGCIFGSRLFLDITNLALHPEDRIYYELAEYTNASGFAIPGLLIGGILGVASAILVTVARFISQTCKSWFYLSGSFMNCAVGWRLFEGLSIDRRSGLAKTVGGLGYVFAMVTTFPLAMLIFAMRKTPLIISVALGLLCSPLVLVYRSCAEAVKFFSKENEFEQFRQNGELIIHDQKSVIQGFKNIYSSLNVWGSFTPDHYLARDADGTKNRWTFFRKCITFNTNSIAERTLDELLVAYKNYARDREGSFAPDFFDSDDFTQVVDGIKDYYSNGCFDTRKEIANLHIEIGNIANFVKSYMKDRLINEEVVMPEVAPVDELPFEILFFGQRQVAPA